ncbi:hypothetical protein DFJ73DRAFT_861853 [Zopfochytrium polystomum]|nr:hypothetical protein DFJ73DRAFT_861853 [Zopfochytrium polystomum]
MTRGKKQQLSLQDFHSRVSSASPGATSGNPAQSASTGRSAAWAKDSGPDDGPPAKEENASVPSLTPHPAAVKAAQEADNSTEMDACLICADPITYRAFGECNHPVCHLCSLRLRALFKDQNCSFCKSSMPSVIYTPSKVRLFADFETSGMSVDKKLSIFFDGPEVYEDVMILLRFNCPDPNCDVACPEGWAELKRHVQRVHGAFLCDLCIRHKKLFTHEHQLYSSPDLEKHYSQGDGQESSFRGHPMCGFCQISFYGDDELYDHCKKSHEQCFLCIRNNIRHQYFEDYYKLERHFRTEHYACLEPECLEKKFQVFNTDIDLKAHELETHPSKRSKGKGERIEVNFSIASSRQDVPARMDGSRRRKGPQPDQQDVTPLAAMSTSTSSFDPSPAEARALRPPPGFGSNLTARPSASTIADLPQSQTQSSPLSNGSKRGTQPAPSRESWPALESGSSSSSSTPLRSPAKTQRNLVATSTGPSSPALVQISGDPDTSSKLQRLLKSGESILIFKNAASSFRRSEITADEFLDQFMALVLGDGSIPAKNRKALEADAGKLWGRLANSIAEYEGQEQSSSTTKKKSFGGKIGKKEEMLRAWNDYRIKNAPDDPVTQYSNSYASHATRPGLTNVSVASAPGPNSTSARVLVIKSNASKQRHTAAWSTASGGRSYVSTSSLRAETPLQRREQSVFVDARADSVQEPRPAAAEPAAPSPPMSAKKAPPRNAAEFPSLPGSKKPPPMKPPAAPAWSAGSRDDSSDQADRSMGERQEKSGGKKKGKTVLMYVG